MAFVFSDQAGANACIALARIAKVIHNQPSELFCNKKYDSDVVENLHVISSVPDFGSLPVDCLFTGTSHPESSGYFEVHCIKKAKNLGLKTVSFIDHWTNFRLRFLDETLNAIYPDQIWVVDEWAKQLAIEEGLPEASLVVVDNPYHEYLRTLWKPKYDGKSYLQELGIPENGIHILFAPDPLTLREVNKLTGFTEAEGLNHLYNVLKQLDVPVQLIVKCHPLQSVDLLKTAMKDSEIPLHLIIKAGTLELINASDLVIGFYSNLLLEAEAMGKKLIRYFPGNQNADLLKHKESIRKVSTAKDLLHVIKKYLNG